MPGDEPPQPDTLVGGAGETGGRETSSVPSPVGQDPAEVMRQQIRRFHELESQALGLASQFPSISQEMRGVSQLLRKAMAKVATESNQGAEPVAPRSIG